MYSGTGFSFKRGMMYSSLPGAPDFGCCPHGKTSAWRLEVMSDDASKEERTSSTHSFFMKKSMNSLYFSTCSSDSGVKATAISSF